MTKVGVLLSGCGVQDGSEVYESVLTILALEKAGADVVALAPDVSQAHVINHYTNQEERNIVPLGGDNSGRSVLAESARIVRGKITGVEQISAHDLDALVIVGGFGVAKNLCTFASDGVDAVVNPDIERLIVEMNGLGKPIGAMCAGPILVALCLRNKNVSLTVGNEASTALALTRLGSHHITTNVDEIHTDEVNKVVSTSAFYSAQTVSEAEPGINALVARVLAMTAGQTVPRAAGVASGPDEYSRMDAGLNTPNASM
jgi:enhancing lycopene biosynthesis protein 2